MNRPALLDRSLEPLRYQLAEHLHLLQDLAHESRNPELAAQVSGLRESLGEPFLFVVVGEVKAGKSSFINALLLTDREICKVAPDPCTDRIYQLEYGETEETIDLSPTLRKILTPEPVLRELSIVDTPGTNTLLTAHQEITERFIPRSDLVVFVFEARNPYRQSAWDFFDYIHRDWRKKLIFILQQADLADPHELAASQKELRDILAKKGMDAPRIFLTSAKLSRSGQDEASGFPELRAFIQQEITGKAAVRLKLESLIDGGAVAIGRLQTGLKQLENQLQEDLRFRAEVRETLGQQARRSEEEAASLLRRLLEDYDRILTSHRHQLAQGLSFGAIARRTILSAFSKEKSAVQWLKSLHAEMGADLSAHLDRRITEGVDSLAGRVQDMVRVIDLLIRQNQQHSPADPDLFSEVAERRRMVMRELREGFARFMQDDSQFAGPDAGVHATGAGLHLATGSGIALIGTVLAAVTQGMVFDVTGGLLATVGILFAGATVAWKRKKILDGFALEVNKGRERMATGTDEQLKTYIRQVSERVDSQFVKLDQHLERETAHLASLEGRISALDGHLNDLKKQLA